MLKDFMPKKKKTNFPNSLIYAAIATGLASGITFYLLGTKSGQDITRRISDKSSEVADKVSNYVKESTKSAGDFTASNINEGRDKAERIIESARMQAEQILQHAENVLKEAKSRT